VTRVALVVLAVFGLSACNAAAAGGVQTYRAHGVSFDHPAGWQHGAARTDISAGSVRRKLWNMSFALGPLDSIDAGAYLLNSPAPEIALGPVPPAVKADFRRFFENRGGVLQAGPKVITVGGMPSYLVRGTGLDRGIPVENTFVIAFDGTINYVLICQHGPDHANEVMRACDQMIRTFKVGQ
jgi:hypothetical protein